MLGYESIGRDRQHTITTFYRTELLTSRVNSGNLQEYSLVNYVYTKES